LCETCNDAIETRVKRSITRRLFRRTLKCITGDTLRDRIRNEDIRNMRDSTWARIRRRIWKDHINGMDDDWLAKIAKNGKPNILRPLGRPPKVGAKVGYQRYIKKQDMVL